MMINKMPRELERYSPHIMSRIIGERVTSADCIQRSYDRRLNMMGDEEKELTVAEVAAALSKTWTRIGMGKVALANCLVGRPQFASKEVDLLTKALSPTDLEEASYHSTQKIIEA